MSEPTPTLGERLRAAREARGFSAQKVADQLHLDAYVIESLESGEYGPIGPAVYVKGHLKRYAGVLGLPVADVLDAYEQRRVPPEAATPVPTPTPAATAMPVMPSHGASGGHDSLRTSRAAVAVLIAAAVAVGLYEWRPWRPRVVPDAPVAAAAAPQGEDPAAGPGDTDSAAPSPTEFAPAVTPGGAVARAAPNPGAATPGTSQPAAGDVDAATVGAGRARLRLSFSAESWVDVRDSAGRRLFAGNGRANSVTTIAGDAPMKVYLGFASGVQLQVNNRVVAIGPQFVAGDVARFEAGADGVLRRDTHPAVAANPHPRG